MKTRSAIAASSCAALLTKSSSDQSGSAWPRANARLN